MKEDSPPLSSFFAAAFVLAFGLNFLWEMLQMSAYAGMAGRPWRETVLTCAAAGVGDAALTLGVYGVGALVKRDWRWVTRGGWKNYLKATLLAAGCAVVVEHAAIAAGYCRTSVECPCYRCSASACGPSCNSPCWCRSPYGSPRGALARQV